MLQVKMIVPAGSSEGSLFRATDGSIIEDDGLETVVTVSLFTDAMATEDDGIPADDDARGFWFDAFDPGDATGSKLWLLETSTMSAETLRRMEGYAAEALAWMTSERVARSVECVAQRISDDAAHLTVTVYRIEDGSPYTLTWELRFAVQ